MRTRRHCGETGQGHRLGYIASESVNMRRTSVQMAVDCIPHLEEEEVPGQSRGSSADFDEERVSEPHFRHPSTETKSTQDVLMLAVEEGFSILGKDVAPIIFYHIDNTFGLKAQDILKKPDSFVEALEAIFGCGAATIEKLIILSICANIGLNPKSVTELTLSDCLKEAEIALKIKNDGKK